MRLIGTLLAVLVGLSGQTPVSPAALVRHLEYKFAFDATLSGGGPDTGTMSVDILGSAADGGMLVNASDWWWNSVRPRQTSQCEVYPNGGISCMQAPYLLPPMQLVLLPLLAQDYFKGLSPTTQASWRQAYDVNVSVSKWSSVFDLQPREGTSDRLVFVSYHGTSAQQGGRYFRSVIDGYVVYDLRSKVPVIVQDVRTYIPTGTAFSRDSVQLQLTNDSLATN